MVMVFGYHDMDDNRIDKYNDKTKLRRFSEWGLAKDVRKYRCLHIYYHPVRKKFYYTPELLNEPWIFIQIYTEHTGFYWVNNNFDIVKALTQYYDELIKNEYTLKLEK